jgi:hypothetical protein
MEKTVKEKEKGKRDQVTTGKYKDKSPYFYGFLMDLDISMLTAYSIQDGNSLQVVDGIPIE